MLDSPEDNSRNLSKLDSTLTLTLDYPTNRKWDYILITIGGRTGG